MVRYLERGRLLEGGVYSNLNANDAEFVWGPVLIRNTVSGVKTLLAFK